MRAVRVIIIHFSPHNVLYDLRNQVEVCIILYSGRVKSPYFKELSPVCVYVQYMRECWRLEAVSQEMSRELLRRAVFRGWVRVTATARRLDWERERKAKILHHRFDR